MKYYDDNGKKFKHSIEARLTLVATYDLGGVSSWTINNYFPQNWLVLESMYDVKKLI